MTAALGIGDFSRATHLSVKTLRHYHRVGVLVPAEVDAHTGYRRYALDQIPQAQVVRRFRDLAMPLEQIRAVLATPDPVVRSELIAAHLARLEVDLEQTRGAVASLRDLLGPPAPPPLAVEHRSVPATTAAAITATIDAADISPWFAGAVAELRATLAAQDAEPAGPAGGIYADALFAEERGEATLFLPCTAPFRATGRVERIVVPAAELATVVHAGTHADVDRSYGALADHVTRHALAIEGPIRERYLVGRHDTADEAAWRTEIGWPIFRTRT